MPDILVLFLAWMLGSYGAFTLGLSYLWSRLPPPQRVSTTLPSTRISVIIPVRNESGRIELLLNDLTRQTHDPSRFEVVVVDDSSTDDTVEKIKHVIRQTEMSIVLIELPSTAHVRSPKKRAIDEALRTATGELIVTTDGDCRVGPAWLESIGSAYETTRAKLISGPVTFIKEQTLTDHLQTVEFCSLIGSGASSISAGKPTMCNGANLAYQREVFYEVGGFSGNDHLASGDDEFLMHKVAEKYPEGIRFLKDERAIVSTTPHKYWKDFYRQRKRWASKWKHYKNSLNTALALYIFLANALVLVLFALGISQVLPWEIVLVLLAVKWVPEWIFIGQILRFLKKSDSIIYIPLVQLMYPFYVTLFGLVVQKPSYVWKDRRVE